METSKHCKFLTACEDGDPSATESTRRKASSFDEISGNHKEYNYVFTSVQTRRYIMDLVWPRQLQCIPLC